MLTITRRDDKVFTFYFYDENGDAINLTGCALYTTVKQAGMILTQMRRLRAHLLSPRLRQVELQLGHLYQLIHSTLREYTSGTYNLRMQLVRSQPLSTIRLKLLKMLL